MPLINPPLQGQARSLHIQQLINLVRGIPANSEAVSLTGFSSISAYALSVANRGATGLGFRVLNAARTIPLMRVDHDGTTLRPNAVDTDVFTVRNFADDTDLFKVDNSGVSFGGLTPVT